MSDLLLSALKKTQREYREKLILAKELLFSENKNVALIELASFWIENKKTIECALNYSAKPYSRFFFTAATILDVDDKEHIPFLAVGDFRIWDDPIFDYGSTLINTPNQKFNEKLKKQILETIDDNIKIIENTNNMIYVLPIRLLFGDKEACSQIAEKLFLSLFKEIPENLEMYCKKFNTIDSVVSGLREEVKNFIYFDIEDENLELEERFMRYVSNTELPLKGNDSEAYIFFFSIIGYLVQAIDILSLSQRFQIYPYVRFKVTLMYATILAMNIDDKPELRNIINTMWACYILHNLMPSDKFNDDLTTYMEVLHRVSFSQRLLDGIRELERENAFSPMKAEKIITALIDEII